jgi:hypothetical protein
LSQIKEILTSKDSTEHPICGSKGKNEFYTQLVMFTFTSTAMALGDKVVLYASFGPPDITSYHRFVLA